MSFEEIIKRHKISQYVRRSHEHFEYIRKSHIVEELFYCDVCDERFDGFEIFIDHNCIKVQMAKGVEEKNWKWP